MAWLLQLVTRRLVPFVLDTLYLTLISVLTRTLVCERDASAEWVLVADPAIACWQGRHRLYASFALFFLVVLAPTATIVLLDGAGAVGGVTEMQELDVQHTAFFKVLERAIKFVAVVAAEFFGARGNGGSSGVVSAAVLAAVCCVLAAAALRLRPVSVPSVNALRVAAFAFAAWTALVSALVLGVPIAADESWLPLALWADGAALLVQQYQLELVATMIVSRACSFAGRLRR